MSPLPGIISDTFEQLGDTVKQAGQQAAQLPSDLFETGAQQVKGQPTQTDKGDQDTARERSVVAGGSNKPTPSQLTPEQQLEVKKRQDEQQSRVRYEQIMKALQIYRQQRAQETPAYLRGKPGAPKSKEEEMELWKKQEEEKKKKEPIVLPGQQGAIRGVGERLQGIVG